MPEMIVGTKEGDPAREGDMGEGGRGSGQPWVTARPTASITVGHGETHSQQRYGSSSFFSQTISLSLLNDKKKEEGRRRMGEVVGRKEEMGEKKKWKEKKK
jgi:hypothetical protein